MDYQKNYEALRQHLRYKNYDKSNTRNGWKSMNSLVVHMIKINKSGLKHL